MMARPSYGTPVNCQLQPEQNYTNRQIVQLEPCASPNIAYVDSNEAYPMSSTHPMPLEMPQPAPIYLTAYESHDLSRRGYPAQVPVILEDNEAARGEMQEFRAPNGQIFLMKKVYKSPKSNGSANGGVVKPKRFRTVFTEAHQKRLKEEFAINRYLDQQRRQLIAKQLNLSENSVKVWFQNRRMDEKKNNKDNLPHSSNDHRLIQIPVRRTISQYQCPGTSEVVPEYYNYENIQKERPDSEYIPQSQFYTQPYGAFNVVPQEQQDFKYYNTATPFYNDIQELSHRTENIILDQNHSEAVPAESEDSVEVKTEDEFSLRKILDLEY